MFRSISLTLGQLGDPRLRSVLLMAIAASLLLIVGLAVGTGYALSALAQTGTEWLDSLLVWLGAVGTFVFALIFFPGSVQLVSGLFADTVADTVMSTHYPNAPQPRHIPLGEVIGDGLRFAVLSIGLNILALPLYFVLPGLNLIVFYGLNGYLLGREYAEMVGQRTLDRMALREFRRANQGSLFLGGVLIAALSTIPVVNLTTPVVATAFAVHEHERLRRRTVPR
ncbi:EI24 domain-containing protein [Thalassobaculum sp. OXR-137]|uniref:EI24 domain-containing protein n=1 Tax=Thalassobaculum sp. OXR-137 TaxID=3100173 RepID=UPI002AC8EC06|nr:EI24 domain-containing protein [Thalassobaculum sp. OXR-137]WPZ35557.1 EI24 domain-containing protein [Thalassobaculum sp. OXR-137]